MGDEKLQLSTDNGARLYDVFVHFMSINFGGPNQQRTPVTSQSQKITSHMQDKNGEKLCYELCREYLSNEKK